MTWRRTGSSQVPCRACGQPTTVWHYADGRDSDPWCKACRGAAHHRWRAAQAARVALRQAQFPELPPTMGTALIKAGIRSRAALATLPDGVLLATPGLGPVTLAHVRAVFPEPDARAPCGHCGGSGWEPDPAAAIDAPA